MSMADNLPEFNTQSESVSSAEPVGNADVESLAEGFLAGIPAQDRAIVGRYVKQWDSGAQKKFREYQDRIKPYQELGELEELRKYQQFGQRFKENPGVIFQAMLKEFHSRAGDQFQPELQRLLGIEEAQQMSNNYDQGEQEYSDVPDENETFRQNVSSELEEIRAWKAEQQEQAEFQQQMQILDNVISTMHNKHGDFDDDYIVSRLAAGRNPLEAIQDWNKLTGQFSSGRTPRQAPNTLGGQGGVPSNQVNPAALRGKDRKSAVQAYLEAANQ